MADRLRGGLTTLLVAVALLTGGCGDDVPDVGHRELIASRHVWSEQDRRRLGLEQLDLRRLDGSCQGRADSEEQRRRIVTRIDSVMHSVLGRDWGGTWNAGCDATRLKFGVPRPLRGRDAARDVRRAREAIRDRRLDDIADLVAVPVSMPAIARAQQMFDVVERDGVLGTGREPSLNAVLVEVARSVDGEGWRRLRATAKRTGVNVVLVRLDRSESDLFDG